MAARVPFTERLLAPSGDCCDHSGFSRQTMWHLTSSGEVESVKIGSRRLISVPSFLDYLRRKAEETKLRDERARAAKASSPARIPQTPAAAPVTEAA